MAPQSLRSCPQGAPTQRPGDPCASRCSMCATLRLRISAEAKRGVDGEVAKQRPNCSWAPWEASRSAGVWGRVRSTLRPLTSRRLSERSERSERSEFGARPQTPSTAEQSALGRPPPSGRLFFGGFLLAKQKFAQRGFAHFAQRSYANTKVTALSGAHPDAASRSEQPPRKSTARLRSAAGGPCPELSKGQPQPDERMP